MSKGETSTRIVIIDDHPIVRAGLRMLIETRPGLEVVGEEGDARGGLALVRETKPDLVLLDLDLGRESGIDLLPNLTQAVPGIRILVLTGLRDPEIHGEAVCRGALGVVVKDRATEDLLQAIDTVRRGDAWLSPDLTARVIKTIRSRASSAPDPETERIRKLSSRELDLIPLVVQGLRNKEIASRLFISEATVRHHLTSIFSKLEVEDRLGLIVFCHRRGLDKIVG
jgi:DNA-binding NarL/FixJ family response regulator